MTDAERQRRRYARRKAGLVRVEVWVPAESEDAVRQAVDKAVKDAAETVERIKGDGSEAADRDAKNAGP